MYPNKAAQDKADQDLLDAHDAREDALVAVKWAREKAQNSRYEKAAMEANKFRMAARLIYNGEVLAWEDVGLSSHNHLINDAKNVAENPSITHAELKRLYQERLMTGGDAGSQDLDVWDEASDSIEEMVLVHLKEALSS